MAYHVAKFSAPLECFAVWSNAFTDEELDKIKAIKELQDFEKGGVGDKNMPAPKEIRDSDVSWIHLNEHSHWLFDRIGGIASRVNTDHFMYDIDGFESLQLTKYAVKQHYNWHMDLAFGWANYERKISLVLMLSDPDDYEGGEFEIVRNGKIDEPISFKPKKGDVVCFASWMPHRVAEVISGERLSLVTWVMGKRQGI